MCVCYTDLSLALMSVASPCLVALGLTEIFFMTGQEFAVPPTATRLLYLLRAHTHTHNGL